MSLLASSAAQAPALFPTGALRRALDDFENALSSDDRQIFNQQVQTPTASDVLAFVSTLDSQQGQHPGRCVAARVSKFLEAIQQFTSVVDVFISSNPRIAALVWGSVKVTLQVASNAVSYFEKVTHLLMEVGRTCPTLSTFGRLYADYDTVQTALCDYYSAVISLCVKVVAVNQRTAMQHAWSSIASSFEADFRPNLQSIDSFRGLLLLQIELASQQEARSERRASDGFRLAFSKFSTEILQGKEASRQRQMVKTRRRLQQSIKNGLTSVDYLTPWRRAFSRRKPSTAEWFRQDPSFIAWRSSTTSTILWCAGLMGAGKTILVSNMIAYLSTTRNQNEIIAHYLCQSDLPDSLLARQIIGGLAVQLLDNEIQISDNNELTDLSRTCENAGVSELISLLSARLSDRRRMYLILIDGMDDCTREQIELVSHALDNLITQASPCIKVAYSGRPELYEHIFRNRTLPNYKMPLSKAVMDPDIQTYILNELGDCLQNGRLQLNDESLIVRIRDTVEKNAAGMFLWVYYFIGEICAQETDAGIISALTEPPKELSKFVDLKLARIYETSSTGLAVKVLQRCGVAKRPLVIQELSELLSFDVGQDTLDPASVPHSISRIVDQCGGLITIDDQDLSVQYTHHSIKQHLFSERCLRHEDFQQKDQDEMLGYLTLTYLHFKELGKQLIKPIQNTHVPLAPFAYAQPAIGTFSGKTTMMAQRLLRYPRPLQGLSQDQLNRRAREQSGQAMVDPLSYNAAHNDYALLPYARIYWVQHLVWTDFEGRSKMSRYFDACVAGSNHLAQQPWKEVQYRQMSSQRSASNLKRAVIWATCEGHLGVFRHCLRTDNALLSEEDKVNLCRQAPKSSLADFVKALLELTICEQRTLRQTVLELCELQMWDVATMLLRHAHNLFQSNESWLEGHSGLVSAVMLGEIDVLEHLLNVNADPNGADDSEEDWTALQMATKRGDLAIVEALLKANANVNASAAFSRRTPLQAAIEGANSEVIDHLLLTGANVNAPGASDRGMTALQAAAMGGHLELAERLLSKGANVNMAAVAHGGRTAIQAAAEAGHVEMVELLLAAKADVNASAARCSGYTALQAAASKGHLDIVKRLLHAGAQVNAAAADEDGHTALQAASWAGHAEVVRLLLQAKADVNSLPAIEAGHTALQAAAEGGHLEIIKILMNAKADVNAPGSQRWGFTALQAAAKNGHLDIVDTLLYAKADVNAVAGAYDGYVTALQLAEDAGHLDVVDRLKAAGAVSTSRKPGQYFDRNLNRDRLKAAPEKD